MKKCMYCGHENEDTSIVCAKCGNTLLDIPMDQMPPLEETHDEASAPKAETGPVVQDEQGTSSEDVSTPAQEAAPEQLSSGHAPEEALYQNAGYQSAGYPQNGAGVPGTGYPQGEAGYPQGSTGYPQDGQGYPGAGYPQGGAGYPQDGQGYPGAGYPQGGAGYPQNGGGYPGAGYTQDGAAYPGAGYPQGGAGYPQNGAAYAGAGYPQGEQGYAGAAYGYAAQQPGAVEEEAAGYEEEIDDDLPSPAMMEKARKRVHSPLFFFSAFLYTVAVIGAIVYSVTGGWLTNLSTLSNTIKAFIGENIAIGYFDRLVAYVQTQDAGNVVLSRVIGGVRYLPAVLIMIGLWMAFTGISAKREEVHTSGLTLMRVILIIEFIVTCLALLAGIGVCVAYVVAAGAAQTMMTLIVGVVALLVMVIFTVLTILFFIQLLFSIRVVRTNCRSGVDIGRIPGFVIFVGIIGCLLSVALVLMKAPDDYIGLIAGGAQAAWLLFISIWGIVYRATVKPR